MTGEKQKDRTDMLADWIRGSNDTERLAKRLQELMRKHPALMTLPENGSQGDNIIMAEILLDMAGEVAHRVNGKVSPQNAAILLSLTFTQLILYGSSAECCTKQQSG